MKRKYKIKVCEKGEKYGIPGKEIKTISRVITSLPIGNFNPFFVTYNKKPYLLKSLSGDLSDPFRRNEDYAKTFYIEI